MLFPAHAGPSQVTLADTARQQPAEERAGLMDSSDGNDVADRIESSAPKVVLK